MIDAVYAFATDGSLWSALAALAATASVIFAGMPLADKYDAGSRVKKVVIERRQQLAERQKRDLSEIERLRPQAAQQSLAEMFRLEQIAGHTGIRDRLVAAGHRSPRATFLFMLAKIVSPIVCALFAFIYMQYAEGMPEFAKSAVILAGGAAGYFLPSVLVTNMIQRREQEIALSFPDALDLMLVCVEGGLGVEAAVDRVAREIVMQSEILAEEMGILSAELALLGDRTEALRNFSRRVTEPSARTFVNTLIQSEQYGTSLATALRSLAADLRDQRMSKAERKAAALPAQLTVPMILFFMPGLFVVILGPGLLEAVKVFSERGL